MRNLLKFSIHKRIPSSFQAFLLYRIKKEKANPFDFFLFLRLKTMLIHAIVANVMRIRLQYWDESADFRKSEYGKEGFLL